MELSWLYVSTRVCTVDTVLRDFQVTAVPSTVHLPSVTAHH